ncbi:hypothetical protein GCM10025870_21080 [Agromyces marinus]|uniref:Uncharacterized protein n=1 Tax=Agromyces marinus TaxID=1389020 RepID=A0ABN6YG61_9MICO|nr:hypothetical protein GCM10025870_21080 [Agromyces marinus]
MLVVEEHAARGIRVVQFADDRDRLGERVALLGWGAVRRTHRHRGRGESARADPEDDAPAREQVEDAAARASTAGGRSSRLWTFAEMRMRSVRAPTQLMRVHVSRNLG